MITIEEFCDKYMDGMRPVGAQREAIQEFLDSETNAAPLWQAGRGAGKTVVRNAMIRYIQDQETKGEEDGR